MSDIRDEFVTDPRGCTGAELDAVFRETTPGSIDTLVNEGGRDVDVDRREVRNDEHWRGFFPADHAVSLLNRFAPLPAGFHKRFWKADGTYRGETTDADGIVTGKNVVRELHHEGRRYCVLTYTQWRYRAFYDLIVPVTDDLAVGKAYVGRFPYGIELLTFGLTRRYDFDFLSPADHATLFERGTAPDPDDLEGHWDVSLVSNGGLSAPAFEFDFERTDHGIDGDYEVLDTAGGGVRLEFTDEQMHMYDFSNWHDTIRQLTGEFMVGKYCQNELQLLPVPKADASLGHLHAEPSNGDERLCVYFVMNAAEPDDE